jgi:hypothetical protein
MLTIPNINYVIHLNTDDRNRIERDILLLFLKRTERFFGLLKNSEIFIFVTFFCKLDVQLFKKKPKRRTI